LIEKLAAERNAPASEDQFLDYEENADLILTPEIKTMYSFSNGFKGDRRLSFNSLEVASRYDGILPGLGLFPFTDSNDSNPYCVCCKPPMCGRIFQLHHDGDSLLKFRSINSFLTSVMTLIGQSKWNIDELIPEYHGDSERTAEDIAAGIEQLILWRDPETGNDELERQHALSMGLTLIGKNQVKVIASFLSDDDPYVSESAIKRLKELRCKDAQEILSVHFAEKERFRKSCMEALIAAGIQLNLDEQYATGPAIRIEPGPIYLDTNTWFNQRNDADILDVIVARARVFLKQKENRG
jgi:hypothetical protein